MTPSAPTSLARQPVAMRSDAWEDWGLVDSGHGRKLEHYGSIRIVRPEPQCLWAPMLESHLWEEADATFEPSDDDEAGRWRFRRPLPETWPMAWRSVRFLARFTAFRHLGLFPEQAANWSWLDDRLSDRGNGFRLLNLFAYTGVASIVAAARGARVTHVDASRKAIGWARENADLSGLTGAPLRWICEDARKYVARELRRGARYDGIVLDPPKYGRGPGGEVWRLHDDLGELIAGCAALLSDDAAFLLLNAYSERISGLALATLLGEAMTARGGAIDWGELALMEESGARGAGVSFFARWTAP
jgi:23S rRNA (cytosine1962-C5)-methyltransferase